MVYGNSESRASVNSKHEHLYHVGSAKNEAGLSHQEHPVLSGDGRSLKISTLRSRVVPSIFMSANSHNIATLAAPNLNMSVSDSPREAPSKDSEIFPHLPLPALLHMNVIHGGTTTKSTPSQGNSLDSHTNIDYMDTEMNSPRQYLPASRDHNHTEASPCHENADGRTQRRRARTRLREAKLHKLRQRNLQTRARAYEKRGELRNSRNGVSAADGAYMRTIRERRTQASNDEDELILESYHTRLQSARDEYGPLEEAYHTLEDRLDREEYELIELEKKISKYSRLSKDHDLDWDSLSDSSDSDESYQLEAAEEIDPLYGEYLSKRGEADALREAHIDLVTEHARLQEAQEKWQKLGTDLLPEDQEMIAGFPTKKARILEELRGIDAEIEVLRQACIREGLFSENEPMMHGSEINVDIDILDINQDGYIDIAPEYLRYPSLLEKPWGDNNDEEKSKSLISTFKLGDTGDRITRWLLHKLRSSCAEVELLARFSGDELDKISKEENIIKVADTHDWQEDVLHVWFIDDTKLPPSAYDYEATTMTVFPLPLTEIEQPPSETQSALPSPALVATPLSNSPSPPPANSFLPSPLPSPLFSHLPPLPSPSGFTFTGSDFGLEKKNGEIPGQPGRWGPFQRVDSATAHQIQLIVRSLPSINSFGDFIPFGLLLEIRNLFDLRRLLDVKSRKGRRAMSV